MAVKLNPVEFDPLLPMTFVVTAAPPAPTTKE
jgi:hypothetical protein